MLLLAGCAFMASCADDDYMELDKGDTELALTADAEEITLDEAAHAENALTLTWTSGTNHGTGNRITYKLELAEAGTSFAEPYVLADEMTQQYTWSATTEQLNTLLRDNFGVKADNRYAVEARVTATVAGTGDVQTAVAALNGPLDCLTPMLEAFQRRRDMAMQVIRSWPWAVCPQPDGAFYLFVDVSGCYGGSVKNSTELCTRLLDEAHVALVPGAAFGDDNCIRFSYAVADDVLAKALEASGKVMAKLAAEK